MDPRLKGSAVWWLALTTLCGCASASRPSMTWRELVVPEIETNLCPMEISRGALTAFVIPGSGSTSILVFGPSGESVLLLDKPSLETGRLVVQLSRRILPQGAPLQLVSLARPGPEAASVLSEIHARIGIRTLAGPGAAIQALTSHAAEESIRRLECLRFENLSEDAGIRWMFAGALDCAVLTSGEVADPEAGEAGRPGAFPVLTCSFRGVVLVNRASCLSVAGDSEPNSCRLSGFRGAHLVLVEWGGLPLSGWSPGQGALCLTVGPGRVSEVNLGEHALSAWEHGAPPAEGPSEVRSQGLATDRPDDPGWKRVLVVTYEAQSPSIPPRIGSYSFVGK